MGKIINQIEAEIIKLEATLVVLRARLDDIDANDAYNQMLVLPDISHAASQLQALLVLKDKMLSMQSRQHVDKIRDALTSVVVKPS